MTSTSIPKSVPPSFPTGAPMFTMHGMVHFEFVDGTLCGFTTALQGPAEVYRDGVVIIMQAGVAILPWHAIRNLRGWLSPHPSRGREVAQTGIAGSAAGTLNVLSAPNYAIN